jgi:UV DNA damage endonuclease
MKYGYACINTELAKQNISTNRTLRRKTLADQGLSYYENLVIQNLLDLQKILEWNESNNIKFFRISADLFTHRDQISINRLPSYNNIILPLLRTIGNYVKDHNHRVSIHADHFTILASQRREVVNNSIRDLEFFGEVFDLMGLPRTHEYKINVHVGTHKPTKEEAGWRFYKQLDKMSAAALSRLTVENDDNLNGFSVIDLYNHVYKHFKIPIVFDYHHHRLNPGGLSEEQALRLALSTWPSGITPVTHYSSSKRLNENSSSMESAHADYIYEKVQTYGLDFDIMFEAKMKEQSIIRYQNNFLSI